MQAFTRFDLLKSKQFQLMKSHKTSALKNIKNKKNSSSLRPNKNLEEYGNSLKQAWSGLEPECTYEQKLRGGGEKDNLYTVI